MKLLWMFLPDEFVILIVVGVALAMMVGLVRGRTTGGIIGGLILMLLAQPSLMRSWIFRSVAGLAAGPGGRRSHRNSRSGCGEVHGKSGALDHSLALPPDRRRSAAGD
jgi:hypothetical protein